MEEDTELPNTELPNSNAEPVMAGALPQNTDFVGPTTPMDVTSIVPPPAPSTNFVKPKPKNKKAKTVGPLPKETKPSTPKPYQLPSTLKKQQDLSPQLSLPAIVEPGHHMVATTSSVTLVPSQNSLPNPLPLLPITDHVQRQVLATDDASIMVKTHPPQAVSHT
ncbi:hypothetical protein SLA2020_403390 [Shorea laevis]